MARPLFPRHGDGPSPADLERAARHLLVRSRREAAGALAGGYRSAFRGGGIEFEESRPYVPGDDVRAIDWSAMARIGQPYVKRFREERDQTVLLALDASGSMAFGSTGRSKAAVAIHAAALVCAAALRAGDRVGLLRFGRTVQREIAPARGEAQAWRLLRELLAGGPGVGGGTDLAAVLRRVRATSRRRAAVFLFSDFEDEGLFGAAPEARDGRSALVAAARQHELVAVAISDPREEALVPAGTLRLVDPERPGRVLVLPSQRAGRRHRYRSFAEARRRALLQRLRADGIDVVALRTDQQPLRVLGRFFGIRAAEHRSLRR
jgi:uncharacterized protein (DUF58 family)